MTPEDNSFLPREKELPRAGLEPVMFCVLGRYCTCTCMYMYEVNRKAVHTGATEPHSVHQYEATYYIHVIVIPRDQGFYAIYIIPRALGCSVQGTIHV